MNKIIRVAIGSERINNRCYELVFRAFTDPVMFELCTPIIYGSKNDVEALHKALGIIPSLNAIKKAEDAQESKLNIMDIAQEKSLQAAFEDCQNGSTDATVVIGIPPTSMSPAILVNERLRIFAPDTPWTKESLEEQAKVFKTILRRDFTLSNPRIAVLAINPKKETTAPKADMPLPTPWGAEEMEIILPAIENLKNENMSVFGPYDAEHFVSERQYEQFDGIMTFTKEQGNTIFQDVIDEQGTTLIAGQPFVITVSPSLGKTNLSQEGEENAIGQSLRNALYLATDVVRHRRNYDLPYRNPLPKLYHEKKDESEKIRFAIPKAKTEKKKEE